jgi:hypothetical protein
MIDRPGGNRLRAWRRRMIGSASASPSCTRGFALSVRDYPTSKLIAEKINFATVRLPDHGWSNAAIGSTRHRPKGPI